MKLYGKELDAELAIRKRSRDERIKQHLTAHKAAKIRGIKPSEILAYERGEDVCPHEKFKKMLGGVHKPFLLLNICEKCGKPEIVGKIESEKDCDEYKIELEEALKNTGILKEK